MSDNRGLLFSVAHISFAAVDVQFAEPHACVGDQAIQAALRSTMTFDRFLFYTLMGSGMTIYKFGFKLVTTRKGYRFKLNRESVTTPLMKCASILLLAGLTTIERVSGKGAIPTQ